jgi:phospholipid:diacylglycerol acyltransferase
MVATNYSFGFEKDEKQLKKNAADHTKWTNPLEVTLPLAPSMKIYCVYGHGKETEVGSSCPCLLISYLFPYAEILLVR